ncbi:MBL fold metallo-hydrolase [Embleya sp. AB8]|uniref:MBL fold metallo-hydrolase n=1 Tax=Embleya sp. AB8 TaxID=3156304 RepID=UPI003C731059
MVAFGVGTAVARGLDVAWIHGSESAKHNADVDIQVHAYDAHTVILRQNMAINYEAPFMFLLFGNERAVLIDTGATESAEFFPLRRVVDELIADWLREHPRDDYRLLVLHTHPHGDHVAGDGQFVDRADTEVVPAGDTWAHFGFDVEPDRLARVDLGGRVLECFAGPGHHPEAVVFHDAHTGFLLTGDTVYPGRLYIVDWAAFRATIDRMIAFVADRPTSHVLGCHIEMTRKPGVDYPILTTYQPHEPPLQMSVDRLHAIRRAIDEVDAAGARPGRYRYSDFVLCLRRNQG